MKCLIFLMLGFTSVITKGQEIGVLKTEKQLLTYSIENSIKYSFSTNERNLRVLTLEQNEYSCSYTFNANSICFSQFIEYHSKRLVSNFEKYLTANFELTYDSNAKNWFWLLVTKERRISIRKGEQFGLPYYNCFVIFYSKE